MHNWCTIGAQSVQNWYTICAQVVHKWCASPTRGQMWKGEVQLVHMYDFRGGSTERHIFGFNPWTTNQLNPPLTPLLTAMSNSQMDFCRIKWIDWCGSFSCIQNYLRHCTASIMLVVVDNDDANESDGWFDDYWMRRLTWYILADFPAVFHSYLQL